MKSAATRPSGRSTDCAALLLAGAWLASTCVLRTAWAPLGSSLGYLTAIALGAVAAAAMAIGDRQRLATSLRAHRPAILAAGLLLAAQATSAVIHAGGMPALTRPLRLAGVLAFGLLFLAARPGPGLRRALAGAGALFVLTQVALLLLALGSPTVDGWVMQRMQHQSLGMLPRFAGWSAHPSGAGLFTLTAVALAQGLRRRSWRIAAALLGLAVVATTMSIFVLLIPAVVGLALVRRPAARHALAICTVAGALAALWVHPLKVGVGSRELAVGALHPSWHQDGLGARHMPVHRWAVGGAWLELNATVYPIMAQRALSCFWEQPMVGAGPGRFRRACPVTTMNTYGYWSSARLPHNQYLGWLAEQGLLGLAAVLGGVALMLRSYRRRRRSRWRGGVLLAIAFGGMLGPMVLALPSIASIAVQLRRRR